MALLNINTLDPELVDEFIRLHGKAYINTLTGGGGYTFLLNQAVDQPVLIINVLEYKLYIKVQLLLQNKVYNFSCNSLKEIINTFQLKSIFINHIIWAKDLSGLVKIILKATQCIDLNIYLHDFFSLCPTINLLDYNGQYCNIPDPKYCTECIRRYKHSKNAVPFSKNQIIFYKDDFENNITSWRNIWANLFDRAKEIIVPSVSTGQIFNKAFQNKYNDKTIILHHSLNYLTGINIKESKINNSFMNIFILGHINEHKGSDILKSIIKKTSEKQLNICYNILGTFNYPEYENTPFLKTLGEYEHEEIAEILNKSEIDLFIHLSICPETFSYVLHEMMATRLPIIAFNIGAQAEFLEHYNDAILVNKINFESMFDAINKLYNKYLKNLYHELNNIIPSENIYSFVNTLQRRELEIREQEIIIVTLRSKVNDFEEEFVIQQNQINVLNKNLLKLNNDFLEILHSTSWKLTKPMRLIMFKLKKWNPLKFSAKK